MFDDEPGWRLHPPAPRYAFSSGRKASPEPEAPGHGPEVPILAEPAPHGLLREPARGRLPQLGTPTAGAAPFPGARPRPGRADRPRGRPSRLKAAGVQRMSPAAQGVP